MPVIAIIAIVIIVIILNKTGVSESLTALTLATVAALLTGARRSRCCQCRADAVRRRAGGYFCGNLCSLPKWFV